MKTITLMTLLLVNVTFAKTPTLNVLFNFDHPIVFQEREIEFLLFPNGEFDFNTGISSSSGVYYRRQNNTRFAPVMPMGVRIEHDAHGRVRRIGNVFLNYDLYGRVRRIGTVYVNYWGPQISQVGGLRLYYDRRGNLIDMNGSVNGWNNYNTYGSNLNTPLYNTVVQHTNDYYYYKPDGTREKLEVLEDKKD
jgi:hypothetical protein